MPSMLFVVAVKRVTRNLKVDIYEFLSECPKVMFLTKIET